MSAKLFGDAVNSIQKTSWATMRATYECWLDIHTATGSLHHVNVATFQPASVTSHKSDLDRLFQTGHLLFSTRKAFLVWVDPAEVGTFELMGKSYATLPWITATQRNKVTRETTWVLGLKTAHVAERLSKVQGATRYKLVCEGLTEMVPRVKEKPAAGPKLPWSV
jgi:hypothetical protein